MQSNSHFFEFITYSVDSISEYISTREGETRLGETIGFDIEKEEVEYVILGISEDLGPQANMGAGGSLNAFSSFLTYFLNMQSNRFLNGKEMCIYGEIRSCIDFSTINEARIQLEELDGFVKKIVEPIIQKGKIPIVIGGGHNNAYPLIEASHFALKKKINVINLDPHADCRVLEGRHSGNSFSYANANGYLKHYTVFGLHEQYNNEAIYSYLDAHQFFYTFFEEYLDERRNFKNDIHQFKNEVKDSLGIELDLDSIVMMPTSAMSSSGFSVEQARFYSRELAKQKNIVYFHLPEGSPNSKVEMRIVGKTLSYLVVDFVKENIKFNNVKLDDNLSY